MTKDQMDISACLVASHGIARTKSHIQLVCRGQFGMGLVVPDIVCDLSKLKRSDEAENLQTGSRTGDSASFFLLKSGLQCTGGVLTHC